MPLLKISWLITVVILAVAGCNPKLETKSNLSMADSLQLFTLRNNSGMTVSITNFGGRVVTLFAPDRTGKMADVVLGYDSLPKYLKNNQVYGALIGRFGNRIAKGRFTIEEKEYHLTINNGENSLHGGPNGFHNVYWEPRLIKVGEDQGLELTYVSPDGEEGYPGTLTVKVVYLLNSNNELVIDYEAVTNKTTVVNLTHHSFFNLAGEGNGDILNHDFEIFADYFLPVDAGLIPTGELRPVSGTPFDFLTPIKAGERIGNLDEQLGFGKGYDHCWVFKKGAGEYGLVARVTEPVSGRVLEVFTTEPGIQFYSGNFLNGSDIGKSGKPYPQRSGFCLETQHFPDSPNKPSFPSTLLKPGEKYKQKTVYRFGVK